MRNKHSWILFAAVLLSVALLLTACGPKNEPAAVPSAAPTLDLAGNEISLPEQVESIISLSPAQTQTVMDLGLSEALVAVDTYSAQYWPELSTLPQFDMMALDVEQLAALAPDVIFATEMSYAEGDDPFAALRELGCCVIVIPSADSLAAIGEQLQFVADCLDRHDVGTALVADMQATLDQVAAIGSKITEKKTVLLEIGALPYLYSCGSGTYLDEMLSLIGAVNVCGEQAGWLYVNEEDAVAADPEVILTVVNYLDDPVGEILSRNGWEQVTAIATQQVYQINSISSNLPNQHVTEALLEMALAVYPDEYAELAK